MIRAALSQGITLRKLLGLEAQLADQLKESDKEPVVPVDNVVQVAFRHVLSDKEPPSRLVSLVVDTLAVHLDLGLWEQLKSKINHTMSLRLNKAMVKRRQVNNEEGYDSSVKSESASASND